MKRTKLPASFQSRPDQLDLVEIDDVGDALTSSPRNKNHWKNGRWMKFNTQHTFKNKGGCIYFVNTGK